MDKFLLLHSGYSIVSRVSISAVISTPDFSKFADFKQLQIPNAQTKYYEILTTNMEHLIIPFTKLQTDVLNLNITFRHFKQSDYFWTRVYVYVNVVKSMRIGFAIVVSNFYEMVHGLL